jgi:pimeloyl-ACP methyl ester carboxylesterase
VSDLVNRFDEQQLSDWRAKGVIYVPNVRTEQQMPLYFQIVEDTLRNKERFSIEKASKELSIPHLIIHGTADEAVNISEGKNIHKWNSDSEMLVVEGGDHTFGTFHPYLENTFPSDVKLVVQKTLEFINS